MLLQEVELKIVFVSDKVQLERPFQAVLKLQSNVDRQLGPLTLTMAPGTPTVNCIQDNDPLQPALHLLTLYQQRGTPDTVAL